MTRTPEQVEELTTRCDQCDERIFPLAPYWSIARGRSVLYFCDAACAIAARRRGDWPVAPT